MNLTYNMHAIMDGDIHPTPTRPAMQHDILEHVAKPKCISNSPNMTTPIPFSSSTIYHFLVQVIYMPSQFTIHNACLPDYRLPHQLLKVSVAHTTTLYLLPIVAYSLLNHRLTAYYQQRNHTATFRIHCITTY